MPTSVNPFISTDELVSAQHELPERAWAQEYRAEFLQLEGGGVFRGVDAVSRLQQRGPDRGNQHVIGVDWGRTNDFTAISVIDATLMEQVALDRFSEIDYELQTERLHQWCELYQPGAGGGRAQQHGRPADRTPADGLRQVDGQAAGALPVWAWDATNASKAALVQSLGLAIERGDADALGRPGPGRASCSAIEASVLPSGMLRYGAPQGQHDDTVISVGLGVPRRPARVGQRAGALELPIHGEWPAQLDRAEQSEQQHDHDDRYEQPEPAVDVHASYGLCGGCDWRSVSVCGCGRWSGRFVV